MVQQRGQGQAADRDECEGGVEGAVQRSKEEGDDFCGGN
jgi:hypothetical protein